MKDARMMVVLALVLAGIMASRAFAGQDPEPVKVAPAESKEIVKAVAEAKAKECADCKEKAAQIKELNAEISQLRNSLARMEKIAQDMDKRIVAARKAMARATASATAAGVYLDP